MMHRLRQVVFAAAIAWSAGATAQAYPSKPIKWIIPYTPGGITDNAKVITAAGVKAEQ